VHFGKEVYRDGVDIDGPTFYEKLRGVKTLPTTSQPSAGEFATLFRRLGREFDSVITILVTSRLSGTVGSALIACKQLQDEATEQGDPPPEIHVVDSLSTSGALSMLVTAAARMAEAGSHAKMIVRSLEEMIPRMRLDFVVDTLEYLHKGGRIGAASALLATLVRIKPILHMDNGVIGVLHKVRTAKRAISYLFELMEERVVNGVPVHVAVLHADAREIAEALKQKVANRFECAELFISEVSPAIGVHAGPGTVGLAYYQ
jgi:DegV family protein with EDD domain